MPLKVVANPLLNPETSPVAAAFFESLANLDAELVRYGLRAGARSGGFVDFNPEL